MGLGIRLTGHCPQTLKSAEEMEEEERAAQAAKLQELIRRGTPADLQEANQLMKIMAGYDQASRTDYRAKAAEEISKLCQKAKLLEEMLGKVHTGETIGQQDSFEARLSSVGVISEVLTNIGCFRN